MANMLAYLSVFASVPTNKLSLAGGADIRV